MKSKYLYFAELIQLNSFLAVKFVCFFILLYAVFKLISIFEKHFLNPSKPGVFIEEWSLKTFKIVNASILIVGSMELLFINNFKYKPLSIVFIFLFFMGIALRIFSIKSLGKLWSYNIEIKFNHRVVREGVYRYFKHPAYLGNIFIPSFYAFLNLYISALLSAIFISAFYVYRTTIENKVIDSLEGISSLNYNQGA